VNSKAAIVMSERRAECQFCCWRKCKIDDPL